MRLVRLLYCLCALLIPGSTHLLAALPAAGLEQATLAPFTAFQHPAEPGELIALAATGELQFQFLFSDDTEDEDSNELPAPDFSPSAASLYTRPYPSFATMLRHPGNTFRTATPTLVSGEATYLLLGVLRI